MIFKARNRDKNSSRTFWAETPSQVIKISDKFSYFYSVFCLNIPLLKNTSVLTNFWVINKIKCSWKFKGDKTGQRQESLIFNCFILCHHHSSSWGRERVREITSAQAHTNTDRKSSKEQFSKPCNLLIWNIKTCVEQGRTENTGREWWELWRRIIRRLD